MTDLQECEFNILKAVLNICEKYNIRYYLVCGSALGAVKYKGFIPWDDDIDVAMPRPDYELFLSKAQNELPDYYRVSNYRTDPYLPLTGSKIKDVRTTFIEPFHAGRDIIHSVFIDVFPLDGYPSKKFGQFIFNARRRALENKRDCCVSYERNLKWGIRYFGRATIYLLHKAFGAYNYSQKTTAKLDKLFSSNPVDESDIWCNFSNSLSKVEYASRFQYGEGTVAEFEGLSVVVPENYDDYLTQKYGDWHAELPKEQQAGHHHYIILDLDNPYTRYVKKSGKGKIKISESLQKEQEN